MLQQKGIVQDRLNLLWIGYYAAFTMLGLRLLHVQVIQGVYYSQVAERNRTQIIHQAAPRGKMFDREGAIIAMSRPAFSLIYLPSKEKEPPYLDVLAANLAQELHVEKAEVLDNLKEAHREETAIHLAENLPLKTMFKLSELKTVYPGVDLIVEARRYYPNGAFAGHLLGYMGKMDKAAWRRLKGKGYRVDSWIGKTGLENLFENELRGVDGEIRMEVDAHGRLKRELDRAPWEPGGNLRLALSTRIQKAAEQSLRASPSGRGAAVVLDPRNGDILAIASVPDFDPNIFLLPDWDDTKGVIKSLPEFNSAIQGTYPPASTFKIITGAALFNEGRVSPDEKVFCPGQFQLGDRTFKCWVKTGHKHQSWIGAFTNSCDVYFYQMSQRIGGETIERYEKMFGLGSKTRIALSGEKAGNIAGPEARRARKRYWSGGDTVNLSIGQGDLLVTPIQMAVVAAAVANRGTLWRPHFIKSIEYSDGRPPYYQQPETLGKVDLQPGTWELLHQAMRNVVKEGTGVGVRVPGIAVSGKTGTAQNPHGDDHAWFVAFAGREGEEPSLALSILVQQGGHGGSVAGPVAKKVIEAAFLVAQAPDAVAAKPGAQAGQAAGTTVSAQDAGPEAPQFPGVDQ